MTFSQTLDHKIQKLNDLTSHEEQLYTILNVYMELFPVLDSYLFRYSPLGYLAEGILAIVPSGLIHIRDMRDDVRSLPIIHSAIHERKAKYSSGIDFFKQTNSKYMVTAKNNSIAVTPICIDSVVIGYICTTEFKQKANIEKEMLSRFTLFGKSIGKVFVRSANRQPSQLLSRRELEVMRRVSWGETTKEIASVLGISELTIQQYVQSAVKKLGVQNRLHAVAELIRKGILH
ncbi:LuxR C-terminal-related transcriptional regulator [Bacillus sp. B15-48]|uniref:helix-turn-helix transcriptional regulator n=1 Tax=Bacillus sp. B15-48 TaxID=1548601 RepID=UPI00193EFEAC|nr:LuxR C-terminal-related transcriptional regulator [Bacillus sp. B15-48]MBM4761684.1 helix-turn-helix transcriptional regulator [Bacillus sp. B15-48]